MSAAARSDKDFYATLILTRIWQKQFCLNNDSNFGKSTYEPYLLRGAYVVSQNVVYGKEVLPMRSGNCQLLLIKDGKTVYPAITQNDFDAVKQAVTTEFQQKSPADLWLDVDTYKLVSVKDEMTRLNNVSLADVQRVAQSLQKQPMVSVTIKKSGETKQ
jgi:hypothetical protein